MTAANVRRDTYDTLLRWSVVALWLALVVTFALHHAPWRDEVRALSFAIAGSDPIDMVRRIGDGHPSLWFLLLRGAYAAAGTPLVLPIVSLTIALLTMALIAAAAPYRWWLVALFAATQFMLFDYSVVARNYGISVLLMTMLAALPARWRRSGIAPGVVLLLLANTNVHSVVLVVGYLLAGLIDLAARPGWRHGAAFRAWRWSAALAALGIALCIASIYPPLNPGATEDMPLPAWPVMIVNLVLPALQFGEMTTNAVTAPFGVLLPVGGLAYQLLVLALSALLLLACLSGRSRGAVVAALTTLFGLIAISVFVYPISYRHQCLWLVFVLSLDWIQRRSPIGLWQRAGRIALFALLVLQVPIGVKTALAALDPAVPYSRSGDLARLVRADPSLAHAIIMSEPDFLIEPLPYYLVNPLYLPRERRFGRTAQFGPHVRMDYSLGAMIDDARRLRATAGRPVLLLLMRPLEPGPDPAPPARRSFAATDAQRARLRACTRRLVRYGPAISGETFGVFLLPKTPLPGC